MPTIADFYRYSVLSNAAYVFPESLGNEFSSVEAFVTAANRQERIPIDLAERMFDETRSKGLPVWIIARRVTAQGGETSGYYGNDETGFAATLFERTEGGVTEKVLAIRGTEPSGNWTEDLITADLAGIGVMGLAIHQAVAMVNHIRRLTTPVNQQVDQLILRTSLTIPSVPSVHAPGVVPGQTVYWYFETRRESGLGLIDDRERITVTGHSLGGHLAAIALRLFPATFSAAYTFNAPGFDPTSVSVANIAVPGTGIGLVTALAAMTGPEVLLMSGSSLQLAEPFMQLFHRYLGLGTAESFSEVAPYNHTIESEDIAPGNDASAVAGTFTGAHHLPPEVFVPTERNSHLIEPLMDSLAMHALIHRLAPAITLSELNELFKAASAISGDVLEQLAQSLHRLLLDADAGISTVVDVTDGVDLWSVNAGDIGGRRQYHAALIRIEDSLRQTPGLSFESLLGKSAAGLAGLAVDGDIDARAYRYALKEGNPFAILGFDYSTHNQGGALDLYDPETNDGQLSEAWIRDRARLLERRLIVNTADREPGLNGYHRVDGATDTLRIVDLETGFRVEDVRAGGSMLDGTAYAIFGTDSADERIVGGAQADRIYGMGGDDRLEGAGGSDRLEGGAEGDILVGGVGNDTLLGGTGFDLYDFVSGDGWDTLIDQDGQGVIRYDGVMLTGGDQVADRVWKQEVGEKTFWYLLVDYQENAQTYQRLTVQGPDGGVTVLRWEAGHLGINLPDGDEQQVPLPATTRTIEGDHEPAVFEETIAPGEPYGADWRNVGIFNTNYGYDTAGNVTGVLSYDVRFNKIDDLGNYVPGAAAAKEDHLSGSEGNDYIDAGAEDDSVIARGGDDHVVLGDGDDSAVGGAGEDTIEGGAGNDVLLGFADADRLDGGIGNDYLAGDASEDYLDGGSGEDYLDGGADDDTLEGGADSDVLRGGDGVDVLYGGSKADFDALAVTELPGGVNPTRGNVIDGGDKDDLVMGDDLADILFGGAGNDVIVGGAGDDTIAGDEGIVSATVQPKWEITRVVDGSDPDVTRYLRQHFGFATAEFLGGSDSLVGGSGNDWIFGGGGNDRIDAGADDDVVFGGIGDDRIDGGSGSDVLSGDSFPVPEDLHGNDYIDGGDGDDVIVGNGGSDHLIGGAGKDEISGDDRRTAAEFHGKDYLDGGDGDDELTGNGDDDTLYGGADNDTLWGDDSDIPIERHGNDVLDGEEGDDTLYGMGGDDVLYGGEGNDTLVGHNDDGSGADPATRRDGNNRLYGEAGNDELYGGTGDDLLDGGDGDDQLYGGEGTDHLDGGAGDDVLHAEGGNSTLSGGAGNDELSAAKSGNLLDGGAGNDTLVTDGGGNILAGGDGDDTLSAGGGNSQLDGGEGNNTLIADGGNNMLFAGTGADTLSATGGNSYLSAGAGNDTLIAAGGGNTLVGGDGNDKLMAGGLGNVLDGGAGNDHYVFDAGFGNALIVDPDFANTLQFNFAFGGSGVVVGLGSLKLSFANGDELHIEGYDPENPYDSSSIASFVFTDRSLSLAEVIELGGAAVNFTIGPDIVGTEGADTIVGTGRAEKIFGLGGNDVIDGGGRADAMHGGTGNDRYVVDDGGDRVVEEVDAGWDRVDSSVSFAVGEHVEELRLTGPGAIDGTGNAMSNRIVGNDAANALTGLGGADELSGGGGNDRLDGGSGADELRGEGGDDVLIGGSGNDVLDGGTGADAMAGGDGDDFYRIDDVGDTVAESAAEGVDKVQSSVSFALGDHVEHLSLAGEEAIDGVGNALDNEITGNAAANALVGGDGNDTLVGGGGGDTMIGGAGDDLYGVDQSDDVVVETADAGFDRVVSSAASYRLSANVEELRLVGMAQTGIGNELGNLIQGFNSDPPGGIDYALFGESGDDTLLGNVGDDWLDGGTGADLMKGGLGADTYVVDAAGDQVVEESIGPVANAIGWHYQDSSYVFGPYAIQYSDVDTVRASVDYTLGAHLENLELLTEADLAGTGNALDNTLVGNSGNNVLRGLGGVDVLDGGAGADRMEGGDGSDFYVVDDAGDRAVETSASGGYDTVSASVGWTLGDHFEALYLTGSEAIDGIGNALNNVIVGNDGDNTLSGEAGNDFLRGGAGDDRLFGGAGRDDLDGGTGADILDGGDGEDSYTVDDAGDIVAESGADGALDRVIAAVDFNLGDRVEGLHLHGDAVTGIGNALANAIYGSALGNVLAGGDGDDWIDGAGGNDVIRGDAGDDSIHGGDDQWIGYGGGSAQPNRDWIDGGAGNDTIDGGSDRDTLYGGDGDDTLYGGYDGDSEGGGAWLPGDDTIHGDAGDDTIDGGSGDDRLFGGDGNDWIFGNRYAAHGRYYDAPTASFVELTDNDTIDGGAGDDVIDGGDGNDRIDGGQGRDQLAGGDGDDIFVVDGDYALENDVAVLSDCGEWVTTTTLVWDTDQIVEWAGQGYDLVLSSASYVLPDNVEALTLTFDPAMIDGDPQRYADLVVHGQNGYGNALDNLIIGNALDNRLEGGEGNDTLEGGEGADVLVGDRGDDTLRGGAGNDRYGFRTGDGNDQVFDREGVDTLRLGGGLKAEDIEVGNDNGNLVVRLIGSGESITFDDWFGHAQGLSQIEFCDGTLLDKARIRAAISAPTTLAVIPDQGTPEDSPFSFVIPGDAFEYPEGAGELDYTATLADGRALPGWLVFDPATRALGGTPENRDVGTLAVSIKATNAAGKSATSDFTLEVWNVNDAPLATASLEDQSLAEGESLSYRPVGAEMTLLADASDAGTGPSVETPYDTYLSSGPADDAYEFGRGSGRVRISDWDDTQAGRDVVRFGPGIVPDDLTVSTNQWGDLTLSIAGAADALTIADAGLWREAQVETFAFADGSAWSGDEVVNRVSPWASAGNDLIRLDDSGQRVAALAGDDAVLGGGAADTLLGGAGHDYLNGGSGSDILLGGSGDDALEADWSWTDRANDLLSGGDGDDSAWGARGNDLLLGGAGDDNLGGDIGNDIILFNRGDGVDYCQPWGDDAQGFAARADTLSLGGGILAQDLAFSRDADDLVLHVGNGERLVFEAWFAAWTDGRSVETLQLIDADRSAGDPLRSARVQQFDFLSVVGEFEAALDADPGLAEWSLADSLATHRLQDSDTEAIGGAIAYRYATEGHFEGLSESAIRAQLEAPGFGLLPQSIAAESAGVFTDDDAIHGDELSYLATRADGAALPDWLSFDQASGTFSGTPGKADVGRIEVALTATDRAGESATQQFAITVTGVNDAPTAVDDYFAVDEDVGTVVLPAALLLANDADADLGDRLRVLAVSDTESGIPATLAGEVIQFDLGDRYQSLAAGQEAVERFGYTIADGSGATSGATVKMRILGANDAPFVVAPLADRQLRAGETQSWQVPADAFADIDDGDSLTLAATLPDGADLPGWLVFDAQNRTFSATPDAAAGGTVAMRITATDRAGAVAEQMLSLRVEVPATPPLAVADVAELREDSVLVAEGNVLANDSDADGDALTVLNGGTRSGAYGTLGLAADGTYRYALANDDAAIQSLAAGETLAETFTYTASDGRHAVEAALTVRIAGSNDRPLLATPLADQTAAANAPIAWSLPQGSFADIDRSDRLAYTASLADGSPLPSWLDFDAATLRFAGQAPAAGGEFDIRVTASDGQGADSFASDVFRLTVAHGNAGVGNGEDPPPPGHRCNFNDGPGTEPGRPGSRGGKRRGEERHGTGDDDDDGYGRRQPADGRGGDWLARWGEREHGGNYLDCRLLDRHRHSPEDKQAQRPGHDSDTGRRWAEIERALGRLAFDSELPAVRERAHGAETRHLATADPFRALRSNGVEGVSLATGSGTCLKGFRGLHEGLRPIA